MIEIKDILKVSNILDMNEEYKQYCNYSLCKHNKPVSLKMYKMLKNKIINELQKS